MSAVDGITMQQKIKNQLLRNTGSVVCEQASSIPQFRCWIVIRAIPTEYIHRTGDNILRLKDLNRDRIPPDADRIFAVRRVFARTKCIEENWDLGPDDEINALLAICYTFEELMTFLAQLSIDTNALIEPWNTDFPL